MASHRENEMTKRWSSTRSLDGQSKQQASKSTRRGTRDDLRKWLDEQGAVEGVSYDEETGRPMRTFTINLTKE